MKRIFCIIFSVFIVVVCSACDTDKNASEKTPVKINLPTDSTVNGYKINSNITTESSITTDKIETDSISSTETTQNYSYCGNKNSEKFHKTNCYSLKTTKDENKIYFKTREDFISYGYSPCKICNP